MNFISKILKKRANKKQAFEEAFEKCQVKAKEAYCIRFYNEKDELLAQYTTAGIKPFVSHNGSIRYNTGEKVLRSYLRTRPLEYPTDGDARFNVHSCSYHVIKKVED